MAGPLSDSDMQNVAMSQMASNQAQQQGALSSAADDSDDGQGFDSMSPQELRDMKSLAYAKGMLAPTWSGNSVGEGLRNATNNEYQLAVDHAKMNGVLRARLAAVAAEQASRERIAQAEIAGKSNVATIMAGKNAERQLSDQEIQEMGLPPGTTAGINNFGRVRVIHSPPAAQQMLTGVDKDGKPQYASPGNAVTPAFRTNAQTYLRQAAQVGPDLDSLIDNLSEHPSAMGAAGLGERALESTVGQLAGHFGRTKPLFPQDAALRTQMEQFNEKALPLLQADPQHQAAGIHNRDELMKLLPDPDTYHTDVGTALTQLKQLRDQTRSQVGMYNNILSGKGITASAPGDPGISLPGNSPDNVPTPPNPSQIDEAMVRQHAKDAIAKGADPSLVAKRAKEQYGIDLGGN
jgi:hypothetical protein